MPFYDLSSDYFIQNNTKNVASLLSFFLIFVELFFAFVWFGNLIEFLHEFGFLRPACQLIGKGRLPVAGGQHSLFDFYAADGIVEFFI